MWPKLKGVSRFLTFFMRSKNKSKLCTPCDLTNYAARIASEQTSGTRGLSSGVKWPIQISTRFVFIGGDSSAKQTTLIRSLERLGGLLKSCTYCLTLRAFECPSLSVRIGEGSLLWSGAGFIVVLFRANGTEAFFSHNCRHVSNHATISAQKKSNIVH